MAEASIPVNVWNPGQVLSCMGFLEAADCLLGGAEGHFRWEEPAEVRFVLKAAGSVNPIESVLDFLSSCRVLRIVPAGLWEEQSPDDGEGGEAGDAPVSCTDVFPAPEIEHMALPVRLVVDGQKEVDLGHWADGSSRDSFKLYAGNRSAYGIAQAMLHGVRKAPRKNQRVGDLKIMGVSQLWAEHREVMLNNPFDVVTPMGGSFNFDPRGAWTAIDTGYSPNTQNHQVSASPLVEVMAAWGLENARPRELTKCWYSYAIWRIPLEPMLARIALVGGLSAAVTRSFQFELTRSGHNKIVNFAEDRSTL